MKFEKHFFSEVEPFCVELYQKRFPEAKCLGSITEINFEEVAKEFVGDWIITGGFP